MRRRMEKRIGKPLEIVLKLVLELRSCFGDVAEWLKVLPC